MKMKLCGFFVTSAPLNSGAIEAPLEVSMGLIPLEGQEITGDGAGEC